MGKKDKRKPIRLPRKLKKDIIRVSGRGNYYGIIAFMALMYANTGNPYTKIKRSNG